MQPICKIISRFKPLLNYLRFERIEISIYFFLSFLNERSLFKIVISLISTFISKDFMLVIFGKIRVNNV